MTIPTPRYQIGDTVWRASTQQTTEQLPCPDCMGSRTWKVITPAGAELTTPCMRCTNENYLKSRGGRDIPSLTVRKSEPSVRQLTVGSVRIDTDSDRPVSYMCRETGVGSGSVYDEVDLLPSENDARRVASQLASLETERIDANPQQITARLLGGLTLEPVMRLLEWAAIYDAWDVARWHRETLDDILITGGEHTIHTMKEAREYIEQKLADLRRYNFIDRHPFEALLVAARASDDPTIRAVVEQIKGKLPSGDDEREVAGELVTS